MALLDIKNLNVDYLDDKSTVCAVNNATLSIAQGESIGIIGESGSGKSTLAHAIMKLLHNDRVSVSGEIFLCGNEILSMSAEDFQKHRWIDSAIVFQKAQSALSPVHKIGIQLERVYRAHFPKESSATIRSEICNLFALCNLRKEVYDMYPFELSGGMRQRIAIAMALMHHPKLLILDEATNALDVMTEHQILGEIKEIQKTFNISLLIISHNLSVISRTSDKICVMYSGNIVESGDKSELMKNPAHPYTKALIAAHPTLGCKKGSLRSIEGYLPDMTKPITGCIFADRCKFCTELCNHKKPLCERISNTHSVSCHNWRSI